jgi:uncharacterized protein YjbI with pentapeptide repeats
VAQVMLTMDVSELLKRYAQGERDFSKISVKNANFRGADLSFIDLSQADLSHADLRNTNLRGANLSYSQLNGANLRQAILDLANLSYANLNKSNLKLASLLNACLDKAQLEGSFLTQACLNGATLRGATLNKAYLNGATLHNVIIQEASLNSAYLIGAYLKRVNLQNASLFGTYLQGCRLEKVNLEGASYNNNTQFEEDFDPSIAKMQRVEIITIQELLNTFNYLTKISSQYLGKALTLKNWERTRPNSAWLGQFSFNSALKVSYSGITDESVTLLDLYVCRKWFKQFIGKSSQTLMQFNHLLDEEKLGFSLEEKDKYF